MFAAFSGKACDVLRRKGSPAQTIHSLIYLPTSERSEELETLRAELDTDPPPSDARERKILARIEQLSSPKFAVRPRDRSPLTGASLLVLDECSMVSESIARDLLSFEVPILVLGDPGQLPPIEGAGYFDSKADFTLTEIHRQAAESPVIQLAMAAREGRPLRSGAHGSSYVTSRARINESLALGVSQIVCGSNKARAELNTENRKLRGFSGTFPQAGERLICLRNNAKTGVFNGQIFETTGDAYEDPSSPSMLVIPTAEQEFRAYKLCFTKPEALKAMPYGKRAAADDFDFAWALTGHKSQGSQWESVMVWADQFRWDRDLYNRWLYTACTRAEERVVVAL